MRAHSARQLIVLTDVSDWDDLIAASTGLWQRALNQTSLSPTRASFPAKAATDAPETFTLSPRLISRRFASGPHFAEMTHGSVTVTSGSAARCQSPGTGCDQVVPSRHRFKQSIGVRVRPHSKVLPARPSLARCMCPGRPKPLRIPYREADDVTNRLPDRRITRRRRWAMRIPGIRCAVSTTLAIFAEDAVHIARPALMLVRAA